MLNKIPLLLLLILLASPAFADDVADAQRMLCAPGTVAHCVKNEGCASELPEQENIPEFIEVDLKKKTLSTTGASGQDRSTTITKQFREDGYLYIQGAEYGRTFSMVIAEQSGDLTFVVVTDGQTASMFGECTPD